MPFPRARPTDRIARVRTLLLLLLSVGSALTAQQPLSPFQERKVRSLLSAQLPCLGCHELDGDGGRNGPSLTTVGSRRSAAYIRSMIEDPQRTLPGAAMPLTRMPAATRELVIRFFASGAHGTDVAVPGSANAPSAARADGPALYARWCASCHGAAGKGDGPNAQRLPVRPTAHANAAYMRERSDDALYDAIAAGGAVIGKSARMPAFGETLSREDIRSLVSYLRALCRCEAPAWSRDGTRR